MAFCTNCGTEMAGAAFCPQCGLRAGNTGTAPPSPHSNHAQSGAMSDNLASALCYLLGLITGVLFLVLAPYNQNRTIRFHAWQSILLNVAWIVLWVILSVVSMLMSIFSLLLLPLWILLPLGGLGLWLWLMWRAYNNQPVRLPYIADIADKQAGA